MRIRSPGRSRAGSGFWVVVAVLIVCILFVSGGASHYQNRGLNHAIAEAYLGHSATQIALSAIEEAYYRLHHHQLSPSVDSRLRHDWESILVDIPDGTHPADEVSPDATRYTFQESSGRPLDFTVEQIQDVKMRLVRSDLDFEDGFLSGALEFETTVRVRMGGFPAGIAVVRRARVRKRYYATQDSAAQSPHLRFLSEDVSREVTRK